MNDWSEEAGLQGEMTFERWVQSYFGRRVRGRRSEGQRRVDRSIIENNVYGSVGGCPCYIELRCCGFFRDEIVETKLGFERAVSRCQWVMALCKLNY